MLSLVIPVYKNAANIGALVEALGGLHDKLGGAFEAVVVVDGSPDESYLLLKEALPRQRYRSSLIALSRNFGSFSAIRAGLAAARGERVAIMAADLQEPPDLILEFDRLMRGGDVDVVIGQRTRRVDPWLTRLFSAIFWAIYRRWVQPDLPPGGVDIFGCTDKIRRELVRFPEVNSSLIGLLFWVGFRRAFVPYMRRERTAGRSAWTFWRKVRYLTDSLFAFSDLPIRLLLAAGTVGLAISGAYAATVVIAKLVFSITPPGYAATIVLVSFFGGLNCFGIGVLGGYLWRTFENSKQRPPYIVLSTESFNEQSSAS
jgi:glycosyltransferase involved in cell wall biosynthesis